MSETEAPVTTPIPNQMPPDVRQKSSVGCWVTAIVTLFVAGVLIVAGLFLPPISLYDRLFGEQYAYLQAAGDSISTSDGNFRVTAANVTETDDAFGVRLGGIGVSDFANANADNNPDWVPVARSALPFNLALQSPVYSLRTTGDTPDATILSLEMPARVNTPDLIDLYGYDNETGQWAFIPSRQIENRVEAVVSELPDRVGLFQVAPQPPVVVISHDVTQVLSESAGELATIVAPGGLQPTLDGRITGSLAPGFRLNAGYLVMPVIRNYTVPSALDTETIETILRNSGLRNTHARGIAQLASGGGYSGVFIDYRGINPELRDAFSEFVEELGIAFDQAGLRLGVVVPQADNIDGTWQTGAYDWQAIGQYADYVQINTNLNPRIFSPGEDQFVTAMTRWAVDQMSRDKILLGISAQSVREISGNFTPIGFDDAIAGLGNVVVSADNVSETGSIEPGSEIRARLDGFEASAGVEDPINAPYIDYLNEAGDTVARMWLATGDALRYRMDATVPLALAGVTFDDLLESDLADDALAAIVNYKTQIPTAPAATDLALRWRIEDSNGVVEEMTTGLNEEIVVTLTAPDGNYAINTSVIGIGQSNVESVRSGAAVALFRPTPTPTPLPTATPTPLPTETPTPAPIVATQGAPAGNPGSAIRPGGGSIVGAFEYGGHVTNAGSERAINAMRRAGMTWSKVQIRYSPGTSPEVALGDINAAKAAGFKVLIGTVGNPADLRAGGDAYINQYAAWLGGIAALGADAIEVWNEPNLAREWPAGQISGAAYVSMLQRGYQAIKSANGSTIVISAAPAPNGAENAFPGEVMNDDRWLRQVVEAGGLNYMDCLGAHYNEGVVSPTAVSGDFRDNYYTRYLPSMMNIYAGIIGGQKPICVTELGYVTPEGYPPLPGFFGWGQNTTVAQQAAWLAQAAAYLSQRGDVRMMIVWNVDFTVYNSDPQGGYAIIRPDGSCPACDALAGAR